MIIIPILLVFFENKNRKKNIQEKNLELLADYPEFVAKFSLLILTGLSIYNALVRIVENYQ